MPAKNTPATDPAASLKATANPLYGSGMFRRRVRLRNRPNEVTGELEDGSHGFRVQIQHDSKQVTAIQGEALRYPMNSCPGAVDVLQQFVGLPLSLSQTEVQQQINARVHCTHLYDLALWAYLHALREQETRIYDIELQDEAGQARPLRVLQDGELVLEWVMQDWQIQAPEALAGNTIHRGFSRWVAEQFGDDEQAIEYAWLAQKGYLVSQARIFDMNKVGGQKGNYDAGMLGVCHTYTEGRIENARHEYNSFRDFTECPEKLLKFEP